MLTCGFSIDTAYTANGNNVQAVLHQAAWASLFLVYEIVIMWCLYQGDSCGLLCRLR